MNNEEMLKAIGEMIDSKLSEMDNRFGEIKNELKDIKKELNEFRTETNERFDTLKDKFDVIDSKNADNHVIIKGDINNIKETLEEIEVDLKLVKKTTVANSEDIEKLTIVK